MFRLYNEVSVGELNDFNFNHNEENLRIKKFELHLIFNVSELNLCFIIDICWFVYGML